ncbi:MFS transporter, ACS family, solute carrier family 17 (sodium-dependent inorganic phosphate cotransporter), other [Fistulifera solaris]|uniref:MFS transporter, ACS family, solute carrier family 17 (Sodium-dependent inorganic phosphate cotransporter), other n=1 Tax=Fistulifera solaris TaxID=1519565 RepID=A0A1Z5JS38_FISSO|nr:MFS transporter, ACS family, solute carrier family 17 (sodium-dependent inorganic phosphate cotransporter), other [Fistulifera solaris]|eukprot:GAX16769.1 MFS transporter, ACS family, solute carrier family 17 (sodium-dependent inorganic phosphate cotransporter), other [Fistulifera solaris]
MKVLVINCIVALLIVLIHVSCFLGTHAFQSTTRTFWRPTLSVASRRSIKVVEAEIVQFQPNNNITCTTDVYTGHIDGSLYRESKEESQSTIAFTKEDENKKYIMLALLWITAFLASLDRVAMSVAFLPMSAEFLYSSTIKGTIASFFSVGYGLLILPAGLFVGNVSPKWAMMLGIAVWSIATLATPLVAGTALSTLMIARALVGAGESIVLPSTQRFLTVWTLPEEKSRALSFVFSGFACGKIMAYIISPYILEAFGWRSLFYVYGLVGTALLIPWWLLGRDEPPSQSTALTTTEKEEVSASPFEQAMTICRDAPWKGMLQSKGVWAMTLAHCSRNWGLYNWLSWMPTFYSQQYSIGVKDSAWLSVLPGLAGIVGGIAAGIAADWTVQNMQDPSNDDEKTKIRNIFQSLGLLGPAAVMASMAWHIPEEAWLAQAGLAGVFGLQSFNAGGFEAASQEKAGPRWAGFLYSMTTLPGVLVGTFGVWVTGVLLDATNQDWGMIFAINALVNVLGAVAFVSLYESRKEFE